MKNFLRDKILYNFLYYLLKPFIKAKFNQDKIFLPLSEKHWNLYSELHTYYFMKRLSFPELVTPKGINEKIQWLKLFDQSKNYINICDKLEFKNFVRAKIGEGYTPKTIATITDESELTDIINNNDLPIVLKTNHDSGGVKIINNDNIGAALKFYKKLSRRKIKSYAYNNGEWAYRFIRPQIFLEKFVDFTKINASPDDYKFYCVNGKAKFCHFLSERHLIPKEQVVDVTGEDIGIPIYPKFKYGNTFIKPANWNEMIEISEKLSEGFKFVRVDLYTDSKDVFVGELTLWPQAGTYKGNGQSYYEKYLDIDLSTFKEPIIDDLKTISS